MGAHGETLLYPLPTATAVLTCIGGWHRDDSTASVCCFAFENGAEAVPPGILNRFVQARFATGSIGQIPATAIRLRDRALAHIGYVEVFEIENVIAAH
jgi:hypothetical protein